MVLGRANSADLLCSICQALAQAPGPSDASAEGWAAVPAVLGGGLHGLRVIKWGATALSQKGAHVPQTVVVAIASDGVPASPTKHVPQVPFV